MPRALIALGGDVRYAASQLLSKWNRRSAGQTAAARRWKNFTDKILSMSVDKLVKTHHLPYPEAETLGPALLAYLMLATLGPAGSCLHQQRESARRLVAGDGPPRPVERGIRQPDHPFGGRTGAQASILTKPHSMQVANLCRQLFRALQDDHHLEPRYERHSVYRGGAARDRAVHLQRQPSQAFALHH